MFSPKPKESKQLIYLDNAHVPQVRTSQDVDNEINEFDR